MPNPLVYSKTELLKEFFSSVADFVFDLLLESKNHSSKHTLFLDFLHIFKDSPDTTSGSTRFTSAVKMNKWMLRHILLHRRHSERDESIGIH